jgi:hypothetical membrane protein
MATNAYDDLSRPLHASGTPDAAWSREVQLPGLLLFIQSALFMTVIMLAAGMAPGYDIAGGAISDLGAIPATALLFNLSLLAVGVLNLTAGVLLYLSGASRWVLVTFLAAGIGAIGAAAFPLGTSGLHGLFALAAFVFFNLEAIAASSLARGLMRVVSVAAGVVGLIFVVLMVIGDAGNTAAFGPIGHGGAERMIVYPVMLWLLAFGGYLMAGPEGDPAG